MILEQQSLINSAGKWKIKMKLETNGTATTTDLKWNVSDQIKNCKKEITDIFLPHAEGWFSFN